MEVSTGVMGAIMVLILDVVNLKLQWKIVEMWVKFLGVTQNREISQSLSNHLHTHISSSTITKVIAEIAEAVPIADRGSSEMRDES